MTRKAEWLFAKLERYSDENLITVGGVDLGPNSSATWWIKPGEHETNTRVSVGFELIMKSLTKQLTVGLAAGHVLAGQVGPIPGQIRNLVTFGDSYTDIVSDFTICLLDSLRASLIRVQVDVYDGGVAWPVYAAGYGPFDLFPFARSGAACSNKLTPLPTPSIFESQLPSYFAQMRNGTLNLRPEETMYTLWIGTNDVGSACLLTGHQAPGVTIVDIVSCAVSWIHALYASGARNFLFQNVSVF